MSFCACVRCHFHVKEGRDGEDSGGSEVLGCFCRFKTSWTHGRIVEKLRSYGCMTVERLRPKFTTLDKNFLFLASEGKLVYELGFETERAYHDREGGGGGLLVAARDGSAHGAATVHGKHLSNFSMGINTKMVIPGAPEVKAEHLLPSSEAKYSLDASSPPVGKKALNKKRKLNPPEGKGVHGLVVGRGGVAADEGSGERFHHGSVRDEHGKCNGDDSEESNFPPEDDLLGAMNRLARQGECEDDSGTDYESMTTEDMVRRMKGYQKFCRSKHREFERLDEENKLLTESLAQAEAEAASCRERGNKFKTHLYKLVSDLGSVCSETVTVHEFRSTNMVYNNYVGRAQGGKGLDKKREGETKRTPYLQGLYAQPKSLGSSARKTR